MLIPVSVVSGLPSVSTASPPVTPTTWYDPSDVSSVTLSGDRVTQINDKTAGGLNATSASGVLLGRERFSPFAANLQVSATGATTSISGSDLTSSAFFVVCVSLIGGTGRLLVDSPTGGIDFYVAVGGQLTLDKAGVINLGSTTATLTAGQPYVLGYTLSASDVTQYINTTGETDVHAQTLTAALSMSLFTTWSGWIGEMLFYDTTLSGGNAVSVITYLMTKWGITA